MASVINRSGEIFAPIWISQGLFEAILTHLKEKKSFRRLLILEKLSFSKFKRGLEVSYSPRSKELEMELLVNGVNFKLTERGVIGQVDVKIAFSLEGKTSEIEIMLARVIREFRLSKNAFTNAKDGISTKVVLAGNDLPMEITAFSDNGKAAKAFCTKAEKEKQ